jgi:uroporphyrin-3 C-methyltransferase
MDQPEPQPEPQRAPEARRAPSARARLRALLLGLLALAGVAAVLWFDTRGRIEATQEEMARRLRGVEAAAREAQTLARQTQDALREMQAKLGALESRFTESQGQQVALEALYQELARNRDEWQLAEIEQVLAIAQQQLQLSGNVRAALLALQLAENRLSRADRPQFLPVRRALARDIERLRSLPSLDLPGMSLKLDGLIAGVDAMPLAYEERAGKAEERAHRKGASPDGFLERLGADLWKELKSLVVVRRIEAPEPPLVPPPQAYFLRENLKLRLLSARVALLSREEAGYREDLRVAQAWIRRYFDARARTTQAALAALRQLSSATISFEPPTIADSLEAARAFKSRRDGERKPR